MPAITNYGDLKTEITEYLFHPRFVAGYDKATQKFEACANRRLRVLPMEAGAYLTTTDGYCPAPANYLAWRTVEWVGTDPQHVMLDYVHPAYIDTTSLASSGGPPQVFTIDGLNFGTRPVDDRTNIFFMGFYQKIPTLIGDDLNTNWLLSEHPDCYVEGVLTELMARERNLEVAALHKARRDELLAEIIQLYARTTGATSKLVREDAEYF
jgi:hypothetical protein